MLGQTFGHDRIDERIGASGMGEPSAVLFIYDSE